MNVFCYVVNIKHVSSLFCFYILNQESEEEEEEAMTTPASSEEDSD